MTPPIHFPSSDSIGSKEQSQFHNWSSEWPGNWQRPQYSGEQGTLNLLTISPQNTRTHACIHTRTKVLLHAHTCKLPSQKKASVAPIFSRILDGTLVVRWDEQRLWVWILPSSPCLSIHCVSCPGVRSETKCLNWRWAQGEVSGCVYKLQGQGRQESSLSPFRSPGPSSVYCMQSAKSKCLLKKCVNGFVTLSKVNFFLGGVSFLQPLRGLPWRRIRHSLYMRGLQECKAGSIS